MEKEITKTTFDILQFTDSPGFAANLGNNLSERIHKK